MNELMYTVRNFYRNFSETREWSFIQLQFHKINIEFQNIQLPISKIKKQFFNNQLQSDEHPDTCIWKFWNL